MSAKRTERVERVEEVKTEVFSKEEEEEEERSEEVEENFEEAMREAASSTASRRKHDPPKQQQQTIPKIPEAVDDFLRNFLRGLGMSRTLSSFEAEWYGSAQKLQTESLKMTSTGVCFIPDALTHQQLLQSELEEVCRETYQLREEVLKAGESLVRMQIERNFHRIQYRRALEEKDRLMEDHKRLRKHLQSFEPALKQLDDKYQGALSQKMLLSLEKERVKNQEDSEIKKERGLRSSSPARSTLRLPRRAEFPDPRLAQVSSDGDYKSSFSLSCSIRAHQLPISCIHLHPRKMILASASDDRSWRLWALPVDGEKVGQMVLTGEGHSDWLSGCSFHPDGAKLATTSGDTTVRLWDFSRGCCVMTLSGHTQPTWSCSFHSCGHFLASCSADKTTKLWDLNREINHLTLRRHTASVNSVCFLPFSDLILTCSADKTLAMWDARLGVCTSTFQGHQNPCNHAAFSLAGNITASCDSHGVINLWDIRKASAATAAVDIGPQAANQVAFSPSGRTLAVACSDSMVRLVEVDSLAVSSLSGHCDGVQSVTFDHKGETVISAGSDGLINVWS
ncbi:sperm-associated antigen 16 protein [Notolabrus celidotus]|uniref:sperm-associated antigen 16 protein n=1 Tax=Notolabrus celidotus TaxID=1203425 RepID=UPI00149055AE|nr:sperm-associated antigen 16 protein [Notolabrus celidotus]